MRIAIDGPAGSGKSTVGAALANALGYLFFDTGVMYRVVTLLALEQAVALTDEAAVTALAESARIALTPPHLEDGRQYTVRMDGRDVTWLIRDPAIDAGVSIPSAYPGVRKAMVEQQRQIGAAGDVVMVGRDIGTVVLPDADLKIYLTASAEERANRRQAELAARGEDVTYDDILAKIRARDLIDSTRATSPLKPALDAIQVDSTGRNAEWTLAELLHLVAARRTRLVTA